jgi:Ser/Thr protein kinase RdoA (MazF antagonist)
MESSVHVNSTDEFLPSVDGTPSAVARRGEIILRPRGPWSITVHALLAHLERAGFTGSPRIADPGFDDSGNETLRYVEGSIAYPHTWSDQGIWEVGRLLRDLHRATADFRPPPDAVWQPWWLRHEGADTVIGHCDAGPWNTLTRANHPVAFLDWDTAGPVARLDEVAGSAAWQAQLRDDVEGCAAAPEPAIRAAKLRFFLDGYELPAADRSVIVDRMVEVMIRDCAAEATEARITPESDDPAPLWALAWRARAAAWMIKNRALLRQAAEA